MDGEIKPKGYILVQPIRLLISLRLGWRQVFNVLGSPGENQGNVVFGGRLQRISGRDAWLLELHEAGLKFLLCHLLAKYLSSKVTFPGYPQVHHL